MSMCTCFALLETGSSRWQQLATCRSLLIPDWHWGSWLQFAVFYFCSWFSGSILSQLPSPGL